MGIEPKNYILSLADSTPLAAVIRSNPPYQYSILDYSWTTISETPRNFVQDCLRKDDATRVHFYGKRAIRLNELLLGCP